MVTPQPSPLSRARVLALPDRARNDVLDLVLAGVRRSVGGGEVPENIGAAVNRWRPPVRNRMMPLLETFARVRRDRFFVQIGSHDGQQQDPLRDLVVRHGWGGIMAEPVPYVFERLRRNYRHLPRIVFENLAIGPEDGSIPFYHLADTEDAGRQGLPIWFDALGSLRREVVLAHEQFIPDIRERIVEITVPCLTFGSLCRRHKVETIDVLHTDTEGYDYEILRSVDFEHLRPKLIIYERQHLTEVERTACVAHLQSFGYETHAYGLDTWCLNPGVLSDSERRALLPVWRWIGETDDRSGPLPVTRGLRAAARRVLGPGDPVVPDELAPLFVLTESEQRYLATGHDVSVTLPSGARSMLSDANPRLVELRRNYAGLTWPDGPRHTSAPDHVSAGGVLPYFRGDNLSVPGSREHPRAMALMLYVYMRHLEEHGGGQLLSKLSEDGLFGCWTTEVEGYGKISCDLLDSVSELLFLEQQLEVLKRDGLRVVDIGAGYGRLAHRMASVHPALEDYCCVDPDPESTFLAGYYLAFRGCTPPARVVALDHIDAVFQPGAFDLAILHRQPKWTTQAIEWWARQLVRLEVPSVFVRVDRRNLAPGVDRDYPEFLRAVGYQPTVREPVIDDPAVREMVMLHDEFDLFTWDRAAHTAATSAAASM